jgi:trehalose-phosphatase
MKYWDKIEDRLAHKERVLFFDYDGTLAPISKLPEQAFLPLETRRLLEKLSLNASCKLILVSGRSTADLKKMVKLKNVIYVGNHGWEIKETLRPFRKSQSKEVRYSLWNVYQKLVARLSHLSGIILENKGFTLTVHYRMVLSYCLPALKSTVHNVVSEYEEAGILKLRPGKEIIEILPAIDWNKGNAAKQVLLLESLQKKCFVPICVGDDVTDEDLFKVFRNNGLTVRVGKSSASCAEYFLNDTNEVQQLLGALVSLCDQESDLV